MKSSLNFRGAVSSHQSKHFQKYIPFSLIREYGVRLPNSIPLGCSCIAKISNLILYHIFKANSSVPPTDEIFSAARKDPVSKALRPMLFCFIAALCLFTASFENFHLYIFKVNNVFIFNKRHEPFLIHSMKCNCDSCLSLC